MNIGEALFAYSLSALGLVVAAFGVVLLIRTLAGKPRFTDNDSLALFGHTRQQVFSRWEWLIGAVAPLSAGIVLVTRWWMR